MKMQSSKKLTIAIGMMLAGASLGPVALAQTTTAQPMDQQQMNQQWQQMDTNNDGKVSKSEYDHYWKQQFKTADTNNNGKLSKQECETAMRNMRGAQFSQAKFDRMWNQVSHDGHITKSQDLAYHDKQFRKAANGNNQLTQTEFENAMNTDGEQVTSL
ncbi:MAG TPA: hypothetical protein VF284_12520 [Rhodanobacteraceae bacterium]